MQALQMQLVFQEEALNILGRIFTTLFLFSLTYFSSSVSICFIFCVLLLIFFFFFFFCECSKLAQKKYKTRHDWVGKGIYCELFKKFKFHLTNKWYMYNSESVLEHEMLKFFYDFKMQTKHLISARRPELVIEKRELAELWTLLSQLTTG